MEKRRERRRENGEREDGEKKKKKRRREKKSLFTHKNSLLNGNKLFQIGCLFPDH